MKPHPIAELFPMFGELELQNLADDIRENGLKEAIITYEGKILDGRNRFDACRIANAEPRTKEYGGKDPVGYVLSKNLHRRHLSTRERAEIAAKIATMKKGGPSLNAPNDALMSQTKAAEALNVSRRSVQRAKARIAPSPKKKPKREESDGWTADQLEEDIELSNAFDRIRTIYGDDAKYIQNGTVAMSRKDVIELSKLSADTMRQIQDLIFANGWKPSECVKFLNRFKLAADSTVEDLENLCLATKGKYWTGDLGGFTHTCKAKHAVKR